ncbi:hypothetical protein ASPCAL12495 [Aspergillus calidoustus]|uniref:Uncharacterized protein n=1 Tax=Aspergillus calidoustus TaxID=454130 RepID=A0A0U5GF39_ASPCI|nr:hypothetical protein ASPCAL12495 [Aspergillus calidoustus]
MATEISNAFDKFQQPEYPPDEALVRRRVELVPVDSLATANAAHTSTPTPHKTLSTWGNDPIQASANIWSGSAEYGREMQHGDSVVITVNSIWSAKGHRGKGDNNSFNLWNARGEIALHLSFRRHDQSIRINAWGSSSGWGDELWAAFPENLVDEKTPLNIGVSYYSSGSYGVHFGALGMGDVEVDAYEAPDSFTYRVSDTNDPMFGESVDTAMYY